MQTVIFDFDGTIADTFVTSVHIFERLTKRLQPFSVEEIERLRGLHALELIRELRIAPWRAPLMLVRGRAMMRRQMVDIKVFSGMDDVFKQLESQGVTMYIMSSNSTANIRRFLAQEGLEHYFKKIQGNVSILGKRKMLRRLLIREKLDPATTIYVGDEGRDIEAAKHVGMPVIAVTWGFNSATLLASHHPTAIVTSSAELSDILLRQTH